MVSDKVEVPIAVLNISALHIRTCVLGIQSRISHGLPVSEYTDQLWELADDLRLLAMGSEGELNKDQPSREG